MSDVILNFRAQGLEEMASDTAKASQELTELNTAQKAVEASAKSSRTRLMEMREALIKLAEAGQIGTQEYRELEAAAGRLDDTMKDVRKSLANAGSDTRGLDTALRAVTLLSAGFQSGQGAAALFGDESEDLQKALLKVNGLMAITNGLQQIHAEYMADDSIFTRAATKAKVLYAAATNGATAAVRLLRLAILGIVGGAVIAGIILLVKNWQKITDAIGITNKAMREFEQSSAAFAASTEQRNKDLEKLVKTMELAGKTQQEINAAIKEKLALDQQDIAAELQKAKATEKVLQQQKFINTGLGVYLVGEKKRLKALADIRLRIDELELSSLDAALAVKKIDDSFEDVTPKVKETTEAVKEFQTAIDPKRLNQWERAFQSIKNILGEGGESLASRLDRLREASAALNKEATGGGGREGATGVDPVVDTFAKRSAAAVGYFELITNINSQIDNIIQQSQDAQLARLEEQRNQGLITEKQYIQKVQALKKKQAEQDKKLSIFNILLNTAQAISKALTAGPIIGPILAGIVAALGAAELAIAKRTPIPAFRKGVIDLKGPGTATSDSIVARLSKGESVMTAQETVNHRDALTAMRKNDFDKKYVPIANMAAFVNKAIPTYYPSVGAKAVSGAGGNTNEIMKLQDELKFIGQYIRQGNNIAATSQQHLRDIKTTKRVIYT